MSFAKVCKKKIKADLILVAIMMAFIIAWSFIAGCGVVALDRAVANGQQLTPEQIKAYRDANVDVFGCFQLAGPPPAGATVWILVPKGTPVTFKFGDNCHVVSQ